MRTWMCASVLFLGACAEGTMESSDKASSNNSSSDDGSGTTATDDETDSTGETGADSDTGAAAFVPDEGRYEPIDFRLKEDTCGLDNFASVASLMPSTFGLTANDAADRFNLGSAEQGTETTCTVSPLDAETGLAEFACETFREGYRSPYGDGFDMEVSFSGEVTEDQVVAGGLTVVLHCMVGGYCDEFARNGIAFPCTIGGDLVLQSSAQD
ncbi:MAG: hypothetical protein CL927_12495 [Deltaproteobacteria bacterium]|nr:hypothetical protein [Deltaproteobacteria bacterium]HCH62647.1 hypothetical protein [Deltaproteobacteria bacterium]